MLEESGGHSSHHRSAAKTILAVLGLALLCQSGCELRTARYVLLPDQTERPGFGLYSYLLLARRPSDVERPVYRAILKAYFETLAAGPEKSSHPELLNATFIPMKSEFKRNARQLSSLTSTNLDRLIDKFYDYDRSISILEEVRGPHLDGPYIISSLRPLSTSSQIESAYLEQNISFGSAGGSTEFVDHWIREFEHRTAIERHWTTQTLTNFVFDFRILISQLGQSYHQALPAMEQVMTSFTSGSSTTGKAVAH